MQRTNSRAAAIGTSLVIGAAVLTACSTNSTDEGDQSLQVVFWNWGTAAEAQNQKIADAFMAANEGVEVSLTPVSGENWGSYYANVATLIAGGERPDLMIISGEGAEFVAANDLVVPIDDYLANDPDAGAIVDDIAPGLLDGFKVGGETLTLPNAWNNMIIYYNTDVFAAAGLPTPEADWTWDEFRATAEALTLDTNGDGTTDQYGFTWASNEIFPGVMPWVANAGGNLTSDDRCTATVDTPEVNEALSFLSGLIQDGIAPAPMPMSDVFSRFQNGQIAMFGAGRWPLVTFVPAGFTTFDIQLYPTGNDYRTVFGGAGYPILTSAENPDLAWEFQKFTVSEEIQQQYVGSSDTPGDGIPALRSVAATISEQGVPPQNTDLFYDSIDDYDTLVPYPAPAKYSDFESTVLRNLQLIFAGEATVDDGLATMQAELDPIVTC